MYEAGLFTWIGDKGNELIARDERGNKTIIGIYDTYSEADDRLKAIAKAFIGILKEAKEEFEDNIKNNELFEYEEIHGIYYGILKSSIDDVFSGTNYVKDIGVLGQKNMTERLGNKVKIVSIFLDVPKNELIKRLKLRGEKNIDKRMERFEFESAHRPNYNLIIQNDNLDKTIEIIEGILRKP